MERPNSKYYVGNDFDELKNALAGFDISEDANLEHPYFEQDTANIMLIEEAENIWAPIVEDDNWLLFENKMKTIEQMHDALQSSSE